MRTLSRLVVFCLALGACRPVGVTTAPVPREASVHARPKLTTRRAPILEHDGERFRDLNKNGRLDPYEDWRLATEDRISDLISRMTLEERVGLLLHPMVRGYSGPKGEILRTPMGSPPRVPEVDYLKRIKPLDDVPPDRLVRERGIRWMLLPARQEPPEVTAHFTNEIQLAAESTRLGVPAVLSSDPRHTRASWHPPDPPRPSISRWPYASGFAALRDVALVERFAKIAAHEYRALGLHVALSPSADIGTEPRWNRIEHTFGEDPELVGAMVEAYVRGFQGATLGPESVATVSKHFPGNGPMKNGLDSHNHYGKWQVYPGDRMALHEQPFARAIAAGTTGIMPGYGIAEGVDSVGMSFSRRIVQERLRDRLHFDGLVVTDWLRFMPWGLEESSQEEIQFRILEAGCDQFGDNNDPAVVVGLVRAGRVPIARIDASTRRVLRPMFQLGLFESPFVDEEKAKVEVGRADFVAEGRRAQSESVVVLTNPGEVLPLARGARIYAPGFRREDVDPYGTFVSSPEQADLIVVKVDSPFSTRKDGTSFFRVTREGSLSYAGADNEPDLVRLRELVAIGKTVVVLAHLERPGILTEIVALSPPPAVLAHFGSGDEALLDTVFGRVYPKGRLPFDLPRDMRSVELQKEDVPFDLESPLFRYGYGLVYRR